MESIESLHSETEQLHQAACEHVRVRLFNTESRQQETLVPTVPGQILLYTCGPTVYSYAHIGNFRTYVFEDLLRRTLQYFGLKVTQVMNLTDVDDKTIRGAVQKKCTLAEFCAPYIEAFFEDLRTLDIQPAEHYPAATDYISGMIQLIEVLMQRGVAYKGADGSVYFSIEKFPTYGRLSHLDKQCLVAGASQRVAHDEYDKDHVCDFVLWKAYDPERDGLIYWESPYGKGRPGWHLECSCMAMSILGETVDIHVGGVDNMFPHHENEIAQSEAATGRTFVKHWMHSEHLLVDNKKMSKSLGNYYTLRDLLNKGYTGAEVRWALISTHYRTQLNFSLDLLEAARKTLQRLQDFILRLQRIVATDDDKAPATDLPSRLQDHLHSFAVALADDLSISVALAALFELVRDGNVLMDQGHLHAVDGQRILAVLKDLNHVVGCMDFTVAEEVIPAALEQLLVERNQARAAKNWKRADELRAAIQAEGYLIEDSSEGARLKKVKGPIVAAGKS